eukprot:1157628-Pelagomonas_calceolata.AAC.13
MNPEVVEDSVMFGTNRDKRTHDFKNILSRAQDTEDIIGRGEASVMFGTHCDRVTISRGETVVFVAVTIC